MSTRCPPSLALPSTPSPCLAGWSSPRGRGGQKAVFAASLPYLSRRLDVPKNLSIFRVCSIPTSSAFPHLSFAHELSRSLVDPRSPIYSRTFSRRLSPSLEVAECRRSSSPKACTIPVGVGTCQGMTRLCGSTPCPPLLGRGPPVSLPLPLPSPALNASSRADRSSQSLSHSFGH